MSAERKAEIEGRISQLWKQNVGVPLDWPSREQAMIGIERLQAELKTLGTSEGSTSMPQEPKERHGASHRILTTKKQDQSQHHQVTNAPNSRQMVNERRNG